jgi:hypothetical protein
MATSELTDVIEFPNRLVGLMNLMAEYPGGRGLITEYNPPPADVARAIAQERTWLAQAYGRLQPTINRWGTTQMTHPMVGVVSQDVIIDAIHDEGGFRHSDLAKYAVMHLDTTIGRLQAARGLGTRDPHAIYRLTSPVYWAQVLLRLLGWFWGTTRGRVIALIVTAIVAGIAQGWGTALFERLFPR